MRCALAGHPCTNGAKQPEWAYCSGRDFRTVFRLMPEPCTSSSLPLSLPLSSARLVSFGRGQADGPEARGLRLFRLPGGGPEQDGEDGTFRKAVSASCKWSVESGCRPLVSCACACVCGHLVMVHRRCGGSWTTTDEIQQGLTPEFILRSQFHTAPLDTTRAEPLEDAKIEPESRIKLPR